MRTTTLTAVLLASSALAGAAMAETTLTIESWRNDDLTLWQDVIIAIGQRPAAESYYRFESERMPDGLASCCPASDSAIASPPRRPRCRPVSSAARDGQQTVCA